MPAPANAPPEPTTTVKRINHHRNHDNCERTHETGDEGKPHCNGEYGNETSTDSRDPVVTRLLAAAATADSARHLQQ